MAGSVNRVTILGNLGRDPEIRSTQNGMRIANLNVATTESWRDKNSGEKRERTEWHRVVVWPDSLITIIEKYVHKGDQIYIEGQLQTRKWTDNNGAERYSTEIVVQGFSGSVTLIGGRGEGRSSSGRLADREPGEEPAAPPRAGDGRRGVNDLDDEIPF